MRIALVAGAAKAPGRCFELSATRGRFTGFGCSGHPAVNVHNQAVGDSSSVVADAVTHVCLPGVFVYVIALTGAEIGLCLRAHAQLWLPLLGPHARVGMQAAW